MKNRYWRSKEVERDWKIILRGQQPSGFLRWIARASSLCRGINGGDECEKTNQLAFSNPRDRLCVNVCGGWNCGANCWYEKVVKHWVLFSSPTDCDVHVRDCESGIGCVAVIGTWVVDEREQRRVQISTVLVFRTESLYLLCFSGGMCMYGNGVWRFECVVPTIVVWLRSYTNKKIKCLTE